MAKFEVGQYVLAKDISDKIDREYIYQITRICDETSYYVRCINPRNSDYEGECIFYEWRITLCTNLDYLRTRTAEQMAKFKIQDKCTYCEDKKFHICSLQCKKLLTDFLNKPYDGWRVEE